MIPGSGRSPEGGHGNHSRVLAWRIPWTEEPGSYSPLGHKELDTTERMHAHTLTDTNTHTHVIINFSKPIGCSTSRVNPGTPQWFSGEDSLLPLQGLQVQSLVGELRSCIANGTAERCFLKKRVNTTVNEGLGAMAMC